MENIQIEQLRPESRKIVEKLLSGYILTDTSKGIAYALLEYSPKLSNKNSKVKKLSPGDPGNIDKIYGILASKPIFEEGGEKYQRKIRKGLSRKISY